MAEATTATMVPKPLYYTYLNRHILAFYPGHTTTGPRVLKEHRAHWTKRPTYLRVNQSFSELPLDQNIGLKWGLHKSQTAGEPGLPNTTMNQTDNHEVHCPLFSFLHSGKFMHPLLVV